MELEKIKEFTHDNVKEFFNKREGWTVILEYNKPEHSITHRIGIRVQYKNKYVLSIVAGQHLYCSPRAMVDKYHSVEIALIDPKGKIDYSKKHKKYFNCDVAGYIDFEGFITRVKYVEQLKK